MDSKKLQAKRIMNDIRRILIDEWDPIGIKGAGPDDEYDSYIGGIYRLLKESPTQDEIIDHLYLIDMVQMGSRIKEKERLSTVARSLMKVDLSLK